jgi:hypothetical protein
MKKMLRICGSSLAIAVCLGVFGSAAWLWHRSLHCADYLYRVQPAVSGCNWHGVGSYRGALLIGSLHDPSDCQTACYCHDMYPVFADPNAETMMRAVPTYKTGALGFGVSRGELQITLPLAFWLPPRTYHVVYVPYYCIMLISILWPIGIARRFWRSRAAAIVSV